MANVLYKVTAKKNVGKLPAGATAEIMKPSSQSAPQAKDIVAAFEQKYGITVQSSLAHKTYFDIVKQ